MSQDQIFKNYAETSKGSEDEKVTESDKLRTSTLLNNLLDDQQSIFEYDPPLSSFEDKRSELGRGSFATTYRMRNRIDNCVYAVKRIEMKKAEREDISREALEKEAKILQYLEHSNIVEYFTCFYAQQSNSFNLVMELVSGGDLNSKIKDINVTFDITLKWWVQLASALCYMHVDMKIQHRDIKPENILLTSDSNIKIIDLGFACFMRSRTANASKVGTLAYFSYEKASDMPYDGRDDVWAAGCVIAELMTKSRMKDRGGSIWMYTSSPVNERRLKLISDCKCIDVHYGAIVESMLEPVQEDRFTSQQLQDALTKKCGVSPRTRSSSEARSKTDYSKMKLLELLERANNGDVEAQYIVGQKYVSGGETKSPKNAFKYSKLAADNGHVEAQLFVGRCYESGDGVTPNKDEMFKYFKKCADQGNSPAQNCVGDCYCTGVGIELNKAEAFRYYKLSADQGSIKGIHCLGMCYLEGWGVEQNVEEGFKLIKQSADQSYEEAQHKVGYCYENGIGVKQNYTEAFNYYKLLAEQTDSNGQYSLAKCFENGIGVSTDRVEAFKWYKLSAEQGNAIAQNALGLCYENGIGVQKSSVEALKWYKKSAEQGNPEGQRNRNLMSRSNGIERSLSFA